MAQADYTKADESQRILDESGVPNGAIPDNHDNLAGSDSDVNSVRNDDVGGDKSDGLSTNADSNTGAEEHNSTSARPMGASDRVTRYRHFNAAASFGKCPRTLIARGGIGR